MAVIPEKVISGTTEDKIKTTERWKEGGRVRIREENTVKDTGDWFDTECIAVGESRRKISNSSGRWQRSAPIAASGTPMGSCLGRTESRRQTIY